MKTKGAKRLTPTEKEAIYQHYLVTKNMGMTASACHCSYSTVRKIVQKNSVQEVSPAIQASRDAVAERITGKLQDKVEKLIDSIGDTDIESGRIPIRNSDGDITGYRYYGPTLPQKALVVGIFVDKVKINEEYRRAMRQDVDDKRLLLPRDIHSMLEAVRGKIEQLNILQINTKQEAPGLLDRAQEVMAQAEIVQNPTNDVVSFDEFDNPRTDS